MDTPTLSIVLPALNEEANITLAVERAAQAAATAASEWEVIVVDDGSTDSTGRLVAEATRLEPRVRLVQHERRLGYGAAMRSGFAAARHELVFFTDSDNQFDLSELPAIIPLMEDADVVAGYRANRSDPLRRRIAAQAWNALVRLLFNLPVRDVDCAFKLYRRDLLQITPLESTGAVASAELLVRLDRAGFRIREVEVTHHPRVFGTATGMNPKVVARAFLELVRLRARLARGSPGTSGLSLREP
jgi:glycosyltransferase involved in cell wall biosynthesis